MKIGVFDSGAGGKSVANAIDKALPRWHKVIYREDRQNVPYGNKTPGELLNLVAPILKSMQDEGCKLIVIACNSVTTTIIEDLRKQIEIPLIGVEPMIKPAAEATKSGIIAVCATPATLNSKRYAELIEKNAKHLEIIEPDCSQWAFMVENDGINIEHIHKQIQYVCRRGADVIVLGCTHYHWIEDEIQIFARSYGAKVIQPEPAIVERVKEVIGQLR